MKVYKILLILLVIAFTFGGCQDKESIVKISDNTPKETTPQATEDTVQDEFVYKCDDDIVYTNEQLEEIKYCNLSKAEHFQLYPTPYIRQYEEETHFIYYSETSVEIAVFDSDNSRHKGRIREELQKISPAKETFEKIKKGDSLEFVGEQDPNGNYDLVLFSNVPSNFISLHYTSDKYVIWIYYDTELLVKDIVVQSLF